MYIEPHDMEIVSALLKRHLQAYEVRAFGSRVHGKYLRKYSDLDLAIMTKERLTLDKACALDEAFRESDLPFRVDLVDWAATSENFRKIIEENYEVIHTPGAETFVAS